VRSCIFTACPEPAIKLFKFVWETGVATYGAIFFVGAVKFNRICCDFGVNCEVIKCVAAVPAFCPVVFVKLTAVSMTCFLVINLDKKSLLCNSRFIYCSSNVEIWGKWLFIMHVIIFWSHGISDIFLAVVYTVSMKVPSCHWVNWWKINLMILLASDGVTRVNDSTRVTLRKMLAGLDWSHVFHKMTRVRVIFTKSLSSWWTNPVRLHTKNWAFFCFSDDQVWRKFSVLPA